MVANRTGETRFGAKITSSIVVYDSEGDQTRWQVWAVTGTHLVHAAA